MEVTYTLTPEDMWTFQQFHARRRPLTRFLVVLAPVLVVLLWLYLVWTNVSLLLRWQHVLGNAPGFWGVYWSALHTSLLLLLFYTLFVAYYLWGGRLLYLRRVRNAQVFREPVTTRLYPDAVLVTTPTQQSRTAWADIRETVPGRGHLYLYTGPATALIIPNRAFGEGAASASAFEAAARAYKADPSAAGTPGGQSAVWPPPPVRQDAPSAPALEESPDPPGTLEISFALRRPDALRSRVYVTLLRPGALLPFVVPLLFAALFLAFSTHAGPAGYALAILAVLLLTAVLVGSQLQRQLQTYYPTRDTALACVFKARPDAFVYAVPNGRGTLPWRDIGAITLVGGDLRLWRKDGQGAYFIPRSAFRTPADARAALDAMRRCQQEGAASPPAAR